MEKSMKPILMNSLTSHVIVFSLEDIPLNKDISRYVARISNSNTNFLSNQIIVIDQIQSGYVGLSLKAFQKLGLDIESPKNVHYNLELREIPESYGFIKNRLKRKDFELDKQKIDTIIDDIVSGRLSKLEKSAFLLSQHFQQYSMDEIENLCRAIAFSGDTVEFPIITYDKHSLGGVPGNKVTLLIVPIIAAVGLLIPKTSSRAITSPSGTADTMEALGCNVSFTSSEIVEISSKIHGMIVWGGALNLAPADDILIKEVEFPLGINPQSMMMASIMAKKKAYGIDFLVLDVPTGKGCKVTTIEEAQMLSRAFGELGQRLGINVECGITFGSLPVGHNIGPALEAREALSALMDPKNASTSLIEKSTVLAGMLLEMAGKTVKGQGQLMAKEILYSGKAFEKMKEIIEAQDGDPNVKPDDISIGEYVCEFRAPAHGWPADINNTAITQIARAAGAPTEKGSGIQFVVKKEAVKAGDVIFRVYTNNSTRLSKVESLIPKLSPITIEGMLLGRI
ncbi:MAG: AMP phosphorylase [Candidatus Hodarchaeales archaeon]|jgi:AMP phosphorylase